MSKLFLNLKHFTKLNSDKDSTTFKHKDGHEVKVAHSRLTPAMRKELEGLPIDKGNPKLEESKKVPPKAPMPKKMAAGGGVRHYDEGGGIDKTPLPATGKDDLADVIPAGAGDSTPADATVDNSPQPLSPDDKFAQTKADIGSKPLVWDPKTGTQVFTADNPSNLPETITDSALDKTEKDQAAQLADAKQAVMLQQQATQQKQAQAAQYAKLGLTPPASSTDMPETTPPGAGNQTPPQGSPQQSQGQRGQSEFENGLMSGYNQQMAGLKQEADATGALGRAQSLALQQQQIKQQNNTDVAQKHFSEIDKESQAIMQDMKNQHIDPKQYWNQLGTGGKIETLLSVIGGGLFSGGDLNQNGGWKAYNHMVDKNIQAQQFEFGKKQNLLEANFKRFGNMKDAADFTRVNLMDATKMRLDQLAAASQDPMAQARYKQASGALMSQRGQILATVGARRTLMDPNAGPGDAEHALNMLDMVDPKQAGEYRERYVPGLGISSEKSVTAETRNKLLGHQQLNIGAQDLLNWAQTHRGALSLADINVGKQKAMQLQSMVREGMLNTVYREGEQPLLDKIVRSDPSSIFNNYNTVPQLKELIKNNQSRFNSLKSSAGFKVSAPPTPTPLGKK